MAKCDYQASNSQGYIPEWCAEPIEQKDLFRFGAKVTASEWRITGEEVTATAAQAPGAGVAVAISGLTFDIPSGSTIPFGLRQGNPAAYLSLTQDANWGDATMTGNLVGAIAINHVGIYSAGSVRRTIQAGTPLSRANNTDPWSYGNPAHDEFYLLAFDILDANLDPGGTLLRHSHQIYPDKLPYWDTMAAALQAKIRANYYDTARTIAVF